MENRKCKKCQRPLPEGYKHKKCENCRNQEAKELKEIGKGLLSLAVMVGGTTITIITRRKK